ncbi:MAG: hypothetical protein JSW67_03670, partial [Candidatus Latescibacterota bacterium]
MSNSDLASRMFVALTLLLAAVTAASERVPENTLIQFEIKDQFDRPHTEHELQERNVLLLCGDRKGSQY